MPSGASALAWTTPWRLVGRAATRRLGGCARAVAPAACDQVGRVVAAPNRPWSSVGSVGGASSLFRLGESSIGGDVGRATGRGAGAVYDALSTIHAGG